ncbi:LYR motif-containing protein 4-like [Pectinophora gossypiella]|uniref:LYR motif-containing protein 4-like n=1 Tax=Pectinophora gossypiella TaxID=13191 RepID=UPI00214EA3F9|nr:LYR motif-containing protein 4-like [Pectinophora gossypiella]XP_049882960.1 LYR motif-containing protein 4-like [Pectinophora gossypiella]
MASKTQILSLYKSLLRESEKFPNYNFRSYAIRRVRDAFKEKKTITDQKQAKKEIEYAKENLAIIQRQTSIGNMFKTEKLVIENTR